MAKELKSRFLNEMTWREAADVMRRTRTVILPIGTVEIHGPHMPMGCDGFIAAAFALRLAGKIDALVAPLEHYSYTGATSKFPGGVCVPYTASIEFVKHIIRGLIATGFKKVLLISVHYPNRAALAVVAREIFEETGLPVVSIDPGVMFDERLLEDVLGSSDDALAEAALMAGALEILGKGDLVEPVNWPDEQFVPVEPESLRRLQKIGAVGYYFRSEMSHQPPRAGVDADKGADLIERAAESVKTVARNLDDYMKFLSENPPGPSHS